MERHARQFDRIAQVTTDIRYVKGAKNIPADLLSRIATVTTPTSIDYEKLAEEQMHDEELNVDEDLRTFNLPDITK